MDTVVDRITAAQIHSDPYAYLTTTEGLDPDYYGKLAAQFPDLRELTRTVGGAEAVQQFNNSNNLLVHINGQKAINRELPIHPIWRGFMKTHFSSRFYRRVIGALGDGIRQTYPDLENRLGKKLEHLTVQPRLHEDRGADVFLDIQFAYNTPVVAPTRVRARHVDDPKKLFSGLFYMRAPDDDSQGGNLEICRWRGQPKFRNPFIPGQEVQNTHIDEDQSELVDVIDYQANTLLMFVNSPSAIHGVTARPPTPHIRRYINIIAELREPLYDIMAYQDNVSPWALMAGNGSPARP
ncbi:MAG: hypothetical protein HQ483_01210 [Rhodospirillales bacterium]|nr:hypothetical protein [Rhodospirillales bacterium]